MSKRRLSPGIGQWWDPRLRRCCAEAFALDDRAQAHQWLEPLITQRGAVTDQQMSRSLQAAVRVSPAV